MDLTDHGVPAYTALVATPLYDVEESLAHAGTGLKAQGAVFAVSHPAVDGKK